MPTLTADVVLDRLNSICAGSPYSYTRAIEPFSFDLQPAQNSDGLYRIEFSLDETQGYLGYQQCELWAFNIWLAQAHQRAPFTAQRELVTAISSLQSTLARAGVAQDWNLRDDDLDGEVRLADDPESVYVVGRLSGLIDFDRAL